MSRDSFAAHQTNPAQRTETCPSDFDLLTNLLFNREAVYQVFKESSPARITTVQGQRLDQSEFLEIGDQFFDSIDTVEQDEDMPPKKSSFRVRPNYTGKSKTGVTKDLTKSIQRGSNNAPRSVPRYSHFSSRQTPKHGTRAENGSKLSNDDEEWITKSKSSPRTIPVETRSKTSLKHCAPGRGNTERPSKVFKPTPKANSSKRVNGKGASLEDAFVISDDEYKTGKSGHHYRTGSLTPPRHLKASSPTHEDDIKPSAFPTPKPECSLTSDLELARIKAAHAEELADLQRRLDASEAQGRKIKDEAKQAIIELQQRQDANHNSEIAALTNQLDSEQLKHSNLSQNHEHLRHQLEEAQASLKDKASLKQQRDDFERLYKDHQTTIDSLHREKAEHQDLSHRKEQDLTTQINSLTAQLNLTKQQLTHLQRDNTELKAVQLQPSQPSPSSLSLPSTQSTLLSFHGTSTPPPSTPISSSSSCPPSQTPSTAPSPPSNDHRLANMRKTYIAIKKKHDMLCSVATSLVTATKGWDYNNFGEFGRELRQLAVVLGEQVVVGGGEERDEKDVKVG